MLRLSRTAVFVEVLKLLVENRLPLDRAALLAAEAAGDAALSEGAEQFAAAIRRGEPGLTADFPGLPPLLSWLIAGGQRNGTLLPALRHAADDYQRRAQYQAELSRVMLPVVVTCSISAVIVIAYSFVMFIPYVMLIKSLAQG
jgi:type II secretory pathway component PulF